MADTTYISQVTPVTREWLQDVNDFVYNFTLPVGTLIPVANGGTGADTAAGARTNLGLVIGTNIQAYDAELAALAGLASAADTLPYFTGSGTAALTTLTTAGRALIDDATASAQRTTLGLGTIATQNSNNVTISGGSITGITDLAVADGGTGASTASGARTNLGLVISTDVQAYDAELAAIAGLTSSADKLPYFTGSGTAALTDLTVSGRDFLAATSTNGQRLEMGLGTMSTQNLNNVLITGGAITGITDITVLDGGTGVSTMTTAYAPVCAGTIADGPLQVASTGLSTSGYILTSNGASTLPSFQAPAGTSDFTGDSGAGGTHGLVIAPAIGDATKFLRGDATWASPAGTGDMVLADVQSVTGKKTFDATKLAMKGSSTGVTTIDTANAGASNYTATLQAATGTIAYTANITGTNSGTNTGDQTITLTGDVTGSGTGSFAATIAAKAVTYAKIQDVSATDKLLGRSTAGSGVVEEITCTAAARTVLDDTTVAAMVDTLGGATTTGTGGIARATSPTFVTPLLGTPTSGTLTNCTGLPVAGGGTGVATMTTAYAPVCAGTTATGALQVASTGLATSGFVLTSNGASAVPSFQAAAGGTTVDRQVFTGSGTWTKVTSPAPSAASMTLIRAWGCGGSGGSSTSGNGAGGGGGGEFKERWMLTSALAATVTVTIGAAAGVSSGAGAGNIGGDTTFGTHVTAYGGGGGAGGAGVQTAGGGGASGLAAGSSGSGGTGGNAGSAGGAGGASGAVGIAAYAGGGGGGGTGFAGGDAITGGGGGGGGSDAAAAGGAGGKSVYGGGGASGCTDTGSAGTAGTSTYGGAGGAGGANGGAPGNGTQPGGGGGGAEAQTSGSGGSGQIEVITFIV